MTAEVWPTQSSEARVITPAHHAWLRPKSTADMAQARVFDEILQNEIAGLEELAVGIEARTAGRPAPRHSKELQRVNARIDEVRRLLDALRDRFGAT